MIRVILLLLMSLPVSARDWYLSATGNDNAACTRGAPCVNVNGHAGYAGPSHSLSAGDRVIFRGGDTFSASLQVFGKSQITLLSGHLLSPAWGNSRAVLKAATSVGYGLLIGNANDITVRGLDISYPFLSGSDYDAGARVVADVGQLTRNVVFDNVYIHDSPMGLRFAARVDGGVIANSRFENNSTPVDLCPRYPSGVDVTDSRNVKITGNQFVSNGFNSCETTVNVGGRGVSLVSSLGCNPCVENIELTDNLFTYPATATVKAPDSPAFIEGFRASNVTVERNRFIGNGVLEIKQACNAWTMRANVFDLSAQVTVPIQWGVFAEAQEGPVNSIGLIFEQNTVIGSGLFHAAQLSGTGFAVTNNLFKVSGSPLVTPVIVDNRALDWSIATAGEIRGNVVDTGTTMAGQLTDAGQSIWTIGAEPLPASSNSQTAYTISARYLPSSAVYGRGIAKAGTDMYSRPFLTTSQAPGAVEPRGTVTLSYVVPLACPGGTLQYSSNKGSSWQSAPASPFVVEQAKNTNVCYRFRWLVSGNPSGITRDTCFIVDDLGRETRR